MEKTSGILKWVTGGLEAFWGIPVFGGMMVASLYWTPLLFMLIFHIVALVLTIQVNRKKTGHILGIINSCVGWIPIVGMVMHILSAVFLMLEAGKNE